MVSPHAGEVIGLQLEAHRELVRFNFAYPLLRIVHLIAPSREVLDVVADFVSDHVGMRKLARRCKSRFQFVKEVQIEIDLLICRAIEGPDGCFGKAARGLRLTGKQYQLRVTILPAGELE